MNLGSIFLLACLVLGTNAANSVSNYFGTADRQRLKSVFTEALSLKDLQQIHYSALGYKLLNEKVVNGQAVCKVITDAGNSASLTTELAFYVATSFKALGCSGVLPVGVTTTLNVPVATEPNSVSEVYYAVLGLIAANQNLPEATKTIIAKNLQMLLKKDDSLLNLGQTFYIASELGTASSFAADRIEDAIVQADEVDGKMLQFEGGLGITSLLLSGSLKLTAALKRAPVITAEQGVKFASYLLSRRSVQTPKGAWALLESLTALADSKQISPASISLGGPSQVSTDSPLVSVRVCDLLGRPLALPTDSVIAQSVTRKGQESVVVLSKQKLTPDPKDQTLYTLDLLKVKPEKGLYKLALSAGSYTGNLVVKVLGRVAVKSAEIGVGDADQAAPAKKQSVTYPNKISTTLEADSLQRLLLKVLLVDEASNKPIAVHQCFVKLANKENKQEIIFVAELDNTQTYKFEMDIGAKSAAFGHRSGLYSVELLVGDAVLANALKWHIADANLHFSQELANTNEGSVSRGVKPEIVHKFREPDVRPSRVFSDLFSGLCAAPLLILLVLWAKLKANVSNFSLSLSAVVFHLSFGGILTLFVVFWLQLNMFETIRYLLPLSIVTFISGHRLLRSIASQRVGKSS